MKTFRRGFARIYADLSTFSFVFVRSNRRRFAVNRILVYSSALLLIALTGSCKSRLGSFINSNSGDNYGVIVVNSPASGVVRRVIGRAGMSVEINAPIVEIEVQDDKPISTNVNSQTPSSRAATNYEANKAEIEKARADTVRAEVEVQRLTPLVASGAATQPQLDAARADFARAKSRLEAATLASQTAQTGLRSSQNPQTAAPIQTGKTVFAQTSIAGTIAAINAREGEKVALGQPLATIKTSK
ncbi:MAG: hypothetical protein H7Z37_14690 [Pyrinomonadaceae bacterium]|nr:hypothetical protein [Pyrinomonadaceae bacterium]